MKIHQLFEAKKPLFSFEIFPPKREGDIQSMLQTIDKLAVQKPDFISVTYGAAGTERSTSTLNMAEEIQSKHKIESLAHLTLAGAEKSDIDAILLEMKKRHINNVLLMRGDITENTPKPQNGFKYASELIAYVKERYDFSIGAACYPEGHVEARSRTADLIHLKEKVAAGADFLISQLFFDNEKFYDFQNEARSLDIDIPIFAGVMPVLNKAQIERMTQLSGAALPDKFKRIVNRYEHNPDALMEAGIAYACEQIIDLLSYGVDGIHFYVLNKPNVSERVVNSVSAILKELKLYVPR